jgi:hypothetical protein
MLIGYPRVLCSLSLCSLFSDLCIFVPGLQHECDLGNESFHLSAELSDAYQQIPLHSVLQPQQTLDLKRLQTSNHTNRSYGIGITYQLHIPPQRNASVTDGTIGCHRKQRTLPLLKPMSIQNDPAATQVLTNQRVTYFKALGEFLVVKGLRHPHDISILSSNLFDQGIDAIGPTVAYSESSMS